MIPHTYPWSMILFHVEKDPFPRRCVEISCFLEGFTHNTLRTAHKISIWRKFSGARVPFQLDESKPKCVPLTLSSLSLRQKDAWGNLFLCVLLKLQVNDSRNQLWKAFEFFAPMLSCLLRLQHMSWTSYLPVMCAFLQPLCMARAATGSSRWEFPKPRGLSKRLNPANLRGSQFEKKKKNWNLNQPMLCLHHLHYANFFVYPIYNSQFLEKYSMYAGW